MRWAWDKRNTYRRAADRGIPVPRTWVPRDVRELGRLPVSYPVAIKPAIKEHFIYHDQGEGLAGRRSRATRGQIRAGAGSRWRRRGHGAGAHPGRRPSPVRLLLLLQAVAIARNHGRAPPEAASGGVRAREHLRRDRRPSRARIDVRGVPSVDRLLRPRRARVQARPAGRCASSCSTSTHAAGATTRLGARAGVDFPALLFEDLAGHAPRERRAEIGVRWVRLVTDLPTAALEIARGRLSVRGYLRTACRRSTSSRSSAATTLFPDCSSSPSSPISSGSEGTSDRGCRRTADRRRARSGDRAAFLWKWRLGLRDLLPFVLVLTLAGVGVAAAIWWRSELTEVGLRCSCGRGRSESPPSRLSTGSIVTRKNAPRPRRRRAQPGGRRGDLCLRI